MSGEHLWIVSSALSDLTPNFVFHAPDIDFCVENSLKSLALRVVIDAGKTKRRGTNPIRSFLDRFDNPLSSTDPYQVTRFKFAVWFEFHGRANFLVGILVSWLCLRDHLAFRSLAPSPVVVFGKKNSMSNFS
jgi:hypothetical protein